MGKLMKIYLSSLSMMMLVGCVSVLPKTAAPAPRYTISAVTPSKIPGSPVPWSLVIADPTSSQLFNTVKVPVTAVENRFEFLGGTEWIDRTPVLFQRALVRSFENSNAIVNVGDFTVLPVSDYILRTDIRGFHADLTGVNPVVVIDVYARLLDDNGKVLAAQNYIVREDAQSAQVEALMATFDRALDRMLMDITEWVFDEAGLKNSVG